MLLDDEEIIVMLRDLGRRTFVPPANPESTALALHRVRLRIARHLRRRELRVVVVTAAAATCLLTAPLYYANFSGRGHPQPPERPPGSGIASEIPASLLVRILESDAARRQELMLTTAMAKDFDGRDSFVNTSLAVARCRWRIAARLPNLLARPVDERADFNEAVLCYGARLLAKTQQCSVPILPVNGHRFPETIGQQQGLDKEAYYLAQDAVAQLREMLRTPEESRVPEPLRLALLEHAANPDRPLPEGTLRQLAATFGSAPRLLVVTAARG